MRRALVTGAAGFIGFHLATHLVNEGWHVTCIDNFSRGLHSVEIENLSSNKNIEWLSLDLTDLSLLENLDFNFEFIFHLAALNGTQNFYSRPFSVAEAASVPTVNLLKIIAKKTHVKRFVLASTSETYAGAITKYGHEVPTDETVPLVIEDITNPRWSYASGKILSESAVIGAGIELSIPWTIIRYHNVYGPRMGDKHVIPDFIERTKNGKYELYGSSDTRSFLFVEDAVRLTKEVAISDKALNQIVNIGSDKEISILELGNKIIELLGKSEKIEIFDAPIGSVSRRCPDIRFLKECIGTYPEEPLESGLLKTIDWYLSN